MGEIIAYSVVRCVKGKQVKLLHTFSLDVLLERNMDEVICIFGRFEARLGKKTN